jgi:hypothetical protein
MNTTTKSPGGCCDDERCDSGRRNRYFPRKHLTADTYQVEQDFQQQRRRLLNRAIHGWGVVYGYGLGVATGAAGREPESHFTIDQGLALDACGRELVWFGSHCADALAVELDELLEIDGQGKLVSGPRDHCKKDETPRWQGDDSEKFAWLLSVHYAERLISPVALKDPCQCEQQEWDQVCETVRFSLQPVLRTKCCEKESCGLHCECHTGASRCCPDPSPPTERGGCRCLCEHLTKLTVTPACCSLTSIGKGLKVDLRNAVPLACVGLEKGPCGMRLRGILDDCGPRRLVKRNDLLFDLIRGCDLTRISHISWAEMHRAEQAVDFDTFESYFYEGKKKEKERDASKGPLLTSFSVSFSKAVQNLTIKPDCFTITVIARTDEDGWGRTLRVPIVGVRLDDKFDDQHSLGATLIVDGRWAAGALENYTVFANTTRVEITVRGDFLLDCNGQAVDANARGLQPFPSGNGSPGDTFISSFLVKPTKPEKQDPNTSNDGV